MGKIADRLRESYKKRVTGQMESGEFEIDGEKFTIYWKPLTGRQQKAITAAGEKSIAEGILMHIKIRALDENGQKEFKDVPLVGMMNDFDFDELSKIFNAMTGIDFTLEDIEGN